MLELVAALFSKISPLLANFWSIRLWALESSSYTHWGIILIHCEKLLKNHEKGNLSQTVIVQFKSSAVIKYAMKSATFSISSSTKRASGSDWVWIEIRSFRPCREFTLMEFILAVLMNLRRRRIVAIWEFDFKTFPNFR